MIARGETECALPFPCMSCCSPPTCTPRGQAAERSSPSATDRLRGADERRRRRLRPWTRSRDRCRRRPRRIGPTAAPGVAFNYRYAFRLPAERIAQVQEQHAQICEALGVARCRITGMRYRVVNENDIEAMLAFKLDPAIARRFGRTASQRVAGANGMLTESEITGTDVASAIRARRPQHQRDDRASAPDRAASCARRNLSTEEHDRLDYEAQQLRQQIAAAQANREEQQECSPTRRWCSITAPATSSRASTQPPSIRARLEPRGRQFPLRPDPPLRPGHHPAALGAAGAVRLVGRPADTPPLPPGGAGRGILAPGRGAAGQLTCGSTKISGASVRAASRTSPSSHSRKAAILAWLRRPSG